jgi:hypothetical protein
LVAERQADKLMVRIEGWQGSSVLEGSPLRYAWIGAASGPEVVKLLWLRLIAKIKGIIRGVFQGVSRHLMAFCYRIYRRFNDHGCLNGCFTLA